MYIALHDVLFRFRCVCRRLTPLWCVLVQSSQNLAQISDLQAQLEEAMKEKQDVQEKVNSLWHPYRNAYSQSCLQVD